MPISSEEIVRRLGQHGMLAAPEAVDILAKTDGKELDHIMAIHRAKTFLTAEDVNAFINEHQKNEQKFEVLMNIEPAIFTGSHEIPNSYYSSKYRKMQQVITERISRNYVSMSNIPQRGEFHIIGMVRDIIENKEGTDTADRLSSGQSSANYQKQTTLVLEDSTKNINIMFSDKNLLKECSIDDVIVVRAVAAGPQIFGKEIIYPGVPVRMPATGSGRGLFISDLHLDEVPAGVMKDIFDTAKKEECDWAFVAGDICSMKIFEETVWDKPVFIIPGNMDSRSGRDYPQPAPGTTKHNIISLSNPAMLAIGGLNVLLCHKFSKDWITKRHLGEPNTGINEDMLVLQIIPDIIHCGHTHQPEITNYKSITIVNSGSAREGIKPVIVDFKDRTARFGRISE